MTTFKGNTHVQREGRFRKCTSGPDASWYRKPIVQCMLCTILQAIHMYTELSGKMSFKVSKHCGQSGSTLYNEWRQRKARESETKQQKCSGLKDPECMLLWPNYIISSLCIRIGYVTILNYYFALKSRKLHWSSYRPITIFYPRIT